jgi:tRNA (guanine37-N1)-methyltransferase
MSRRSASSSSSRPGSSTSAAMLRISIVTIFPDFFTGPLALSIPARARAAGAVDYRLVDLRDHTHDRHRTVDDYPYGGGPGMVMKPAPFFEACEAIGARAPIVLVSARGRRFAQADAARFAAGEELTILCGHYKDVDQRVADHLATEELSLGDFVLSGGEPAALAIVDASVRLLPGAMSDLDSARTDSFDERYEGGLSAPSYTRPPEYRGLAVPGVLLSGDHERIAQWRTAEGERLTAERWARDREAFERRLGEREAKRRAEAEARDAKERKKARRRKKPASGGGEE